MQASAKSHWSCQGLAGARWSDKVEGTALARLCTCPPSRSFNGLALRCRLFDAMLQTTAGAVRCAAPLLLLAMFRS